MIMYDAQDCYLVVAEFVPILFETYDAWHLRSYSM